MQEKPILFSGPMVNAILEGKKTQTRRVMKEPWKIELPHTVRGDGPFGDTRAEPGIYEAHHNRNGAVSVQASNGRLLGIKPAEFEWVVPWGKPGDHLWVRETWAHVDGEVWYAADGIDVPRDDGVKLRPSIFMPRWASRITLEITGVKVERVQEISEADARAEGCTGYTFTEQGREGMTEPAAYDFQLLWDSINGKRAGCAWSDNPFVWCVSFKQV